MAAILAYAPAAVAQISPGDLSEAHAHLEGMENCTACHAIGRALANDKCLACHTDLQSRIAAGKGSHARLGNTPCAECHKEHHGRSFSLVHFDPAGFDHRARTGFPLLGRHGTVTCRQCHRKEFVRDPAVRKRGDRALARTYQGLATSCVSCHADVHQRQFSAECSTCHSQERWKPAERFDHKRARFTLTGAHETVPCAKCHNASPQQPDLVRYRAVAYAACSDCHRDPHQGRFKEACSSCHTTQGWKLAGDRFNHASTRFPLRGKHALLRCEQCHGGRSGAGTGKSFHIAQFQRCSDCHADPHRGRFTREGSGKTCQSCHTETGWDHGRIAGFDHSRTAFPLRGKHQRVSCARCHGGKEALPQAVRAVEAGTTERCASCHADPHAGQFPASTDCSACHGEAGFLPSLFSVERHRSARFSLEGSHEAVPCVRCHTPGEVKGKTVRLFRFSGSRACADCHRDPHPPEFKRKPQWACESCHSATSWTSLRFAHEQTAFLLDGRHTSVPCAGCHSTRGTARRENGWAFVGVPRTCAGCHGDSGAGAKRGKGAQP